MAWEARGDNRYYYRKAWQDGRCVSLYLGSGQAAAMMATYDARMQHAAATARRAELDHRQQINAGSQAVKELAAELRLVVSAVLIANDYHQHKRQWRKRMRPGHLAYGEMSPIPAALLPPDPKEVQRGLDALGDAFRMPGLENVAVEDMTAEMAQNEKKRRATIRQVLNDYPCIWPHLRTRISKTGELLIKVMAGSKDSVRGQMAMHMLTGMRTELGYDTSPLLEQMLIEHVTLAYLDLDIIQNFYAQSALDSHTYAAGTYWDRRLTSAQHRYLRAVESLARVRRLSNSAPLQINIGGQQVNVAGYSQ